jgi:CBS domain-containing protein
MSIASLVSRPVSVLPPTASCAEAARRMRRQNIGSIVVEEDGAPIGIVTDRDLVLRVLAEEIAPANLSVASVMSRFPVFLTADRELGEAIQLMSEMQVRRLPVMKPNGRLMGMLSLDDVLVQLAGQLGQVKDLLRGELARAESEEDEPRRAALDV